ncbi:hypothetical protein Pint_36541 [Pistacia integerrima]|uniref:Uncharacterized protein n=1 Tax=Pistacia integerrima TaxID=434235 RepID=A0ACC0Y370_9ROSI|nr:hypothetical protein Pint_36541 [Pistacia integerrima]
MGAVRILQKLFPEPGQLQFIYADLGDAKSRLLMSVKVHLNLLGITSMKVMQFSEPIG